MADELDEFDPRRFMGPRPIDSLLDAYRTKSLAEKAFPEGRAQKEALRDFIARWNGAVPDYYDGFAASVQLEMTDVLRSKALQVLGKGPAREFDWGRLPEHPILMQLNEKTVSLGGGKGRKEAVEMSKSNPPVPGKSRWSWRRE